MFRRIVRRLALPLMAVGFLVVLLAVPTELLARAGGGEGYSGGHSSGGGSGGGGGGDGGAILYLVFELLKLCFYHPAVGIPIVLVVAGFFVYAYYKGQDSYQASVIRRATADRDVRRQPAIAAEIRAQDPAFDPDAFLARVRDAFLKIQQAWAGQDLSAVRPFISDAVHERFGLQFDEQKAMGIRNRMDRVTVQRATLAGARSDELFDELDVRIQASAVDQKVRLADGGVVSGSPLPQPFVEVWSFLRRRGAVSHPEKPGLMEGCCPNCGAAVAMNQNANCQYCGALLRSGQYDWVLVEITQEYEWQPRERAGAPGVDAVRARDPEFNPQELEDRASVVFWRRTAADRLNSAKPIRKVTTDAFAEAYEQRTARAAGQPRSYHGECAVGAVNLLGVVPAGGGGGAVPDDGQDRALVEVRWSGWRFTAFPDGRPTVRGEQSSVVHALFVLARRADAKSNPDQSVASAHCPSCGAPEAGGTNGA
ncbi:MAG TPA: Tim44-like domain-containing protein, partial [Humisphaera sp.]